MTKTKYLHLFETESEFSNYTEGSEYVEPFVSVTEEDNNRVDYNQGSNNSEIEVGE